MGKRDRARKKKAAKRKVNRQQYRQVRERKHYSVFNGDGNAAPTGGLGEGGAGEDEKLPLAAVPVAKRSKKPRGQADQKLANQAAILILGDGDFTFTRGLIRSRPDRDGSGILATSYDSEDAVKAKYPNAEDVLTEIRRYKASIMHGVDCRKLHTGALSQRKFSRIIFNFPHSGKQRVHVNKALLRNFFKSAKNVLLPDGQIHVTLRDKPPYSNWKLGEQASVEGFKLQASRLFNEKMFPGYRHRTTLADAEKFDSRFCKTRIFVMGTKKGNKNKLLTNEKEHSSSKRRKVEGMDCHGLPAIESSSVKIKKRTRQTNSEDSTPSKRAKPSLLVQGQEDEKYSMDCDSQDDESSDQQDSSDAIFDVFGYSSRVNLIENSTCSTSPCESPSPAWLQDSSIGPRRTKQRRKFSRMQGQLGNPNRSPPNRSPPLVSTMNKLHFGDSPYQ
eukprot:CAMPEP_0114501880 /NCGR_PEP_ID=MMETSP0109-20121206/8743_1 /TAXON_ID=29199 /ORGANISM="Chlorarachnion reptans, Strain CCCM449" /LENGTH=444 /DNA_ID=CAMNT_0001679657 /DNA_START=100 /DNA_END=1434 /DNA_ORIENTATION=+